MFLCIFEHHEGADEKLFMTEYIKHISIRPSKFPDCVHCTLHNMIILIYSLFHFKFNIQWFEVIY